MMKAVVIGASLLSTACVPVVQHGPWVRKGYSGSVGGSFVAAHEIGESNRVTPIIDLQGGVRWGFPSGDSTSEGVSIGLQVPLIALLALRDAAAPDDDFTFFRLLNFDGYIALPAIKGLSPAVGLTRSHFHTLPYVQLGRYDKWYTTQAVLMLEDSESWMWAPSFSWVRPNPGGSRTHLTLSGALAGSGDDRILMGGFSIIFEFARARN